MAEFEKGGRDDKKRTGSYLEDLVDGLWDLFLTDKEVAERAKGSDSITLRKGQALSFSEEEILKINMDSNRSDPRLN